MKSRFLLLPTAILLATLLPAGETEPYYVSEPSVPSVTPPLRDLPEARDPENLFQLEGKPRGSQGLFIPEINFSPRENPLARLQSVAPAASEKTQRAFGTTIANWEGMDYNIFPPDPTGDVGPNHVVQGVNASGGSAIQVWDKNGTSLLSPKLMETLATSSPCTSGFCDPIVLYDRAADRWMISEFDSTIDNLCVYVSTSPDPTGTYYYYYFNPPGTDQDYPHYGIWPAADNSAYFVAANNGGNVFALERDAMLAGLPARLVAYTVPLLSGFGFQLTMPANFTGPTLPPASSGGFFVRPRDTELHGGTCTNCDLLEIWEFKVTWGATPTGSFTQLTSAQLTDWDQTVCGTTQFGCMPQMGTTRLLDPIREPIHFPLQYRNFGTHETLVAGFVEDVDGTDHVAVHWFELRRTPPGSGNWTKHQEGVLANDAYHRGVTSVAMDGSGNIALGYTRTSTTSYAGAYYAGRLASDPLGTLSSTDNLIQAGVAYQSSNDRWGDYAGMAVDPEDDCTFWFFGMYMESGSNATRVASFKFDECGCLQAPSAPAASAAAIQPDAIQVHWNDSDLPSVTQYRVYRAETAGGPYTLVATVPDTNPGPTGYTYNDAPLAAGKTYYYVVDATDGVACTSPLSAEVSATLYGTNIVYHAHRNFVELTGNGDGAFNQGEKWSVQVDLRNLGNLNATDVEALLSGDGLTACGPCAVASLASGGAEIKTCTVEFVIDSDFNTSRGCPAELFFGLVSKSCDQQTPAGLDESNAFSETVASGGMTVADEAGATGTVTRRTTSTFSTINNPVASIPGILTTCTVDITLTPPTATGDTLTVRVEHDPGNDGTYEFTQTVYSGARSGWTNVTGFNLSSMVNGTAIGNGRWRLVIVHSGTGNTGTNGTLSSWTLHLTSAGWSCAYTGTGSCGAVAPPEVSAADPRRLKAAKGAVPGRVDLLFEDVGASHYQVYVSNGPSTAPFRVADPANGDTLCALSGWTGPDPDGMLSLQGVDLESGITGPKTALFFLVTADNGPGTEGPLGFATGPTARTADAYCNR